MSSVPRDLSLKVLAQLVDMSESALAAFLRSRVKPSDRERWTFVEGLSVKKLPTNEWRVRVRLCWLEDGRVGIWLNLTTFAARTGRIASSLRDKVADASYWNGGCQEARVEDRRFRCFAGRWKVLVALIVDFGSSDLRSSRPCDESAPRASPASDEATSAAPSFLDTFDISRQPQPRCARRST